MANTWVHLCLMKSECKASNEKCGHRPTVCGPSHTMSLYFPLPVIVFLHLSKGIHPDSFSLSLSWSEPLPVIVNLPDRFWNSSCGRLPRRLHACSALCPNLLLSLLNCVNSFKSQIYCHVSVCLGCKGDASCDIAIWMCFYKRLTARHVHTGGQAFWANQVIKYKLYVSEKRCTIASQTTRQGSCDLTIQICLN
jgi:hypothetical protein